MLLFFLVPDTFWDRTPWPKNTLDRTTSTIDGTIEKPESSIYSTQSGGPKEGPEDAVHRAASASPSVPSQDANFTEKTDTPTGKINLLEVEKAGAADGYGERPVSVAVGEHSSISDPESQNMMPNSFKSGFSLYGERQQNVGWWKAAFRPFVLFAYPAVLWSALVYSLSIGWLIVISESMAEVYQHNPYNFSRLGTGLIYISPFIGGLMGTAVAGKLSDFLVNLMCKRNGGIFEPEFRLVMAIPVAISTAIGLMGFGWSADEQDSWIVPTIFFGIISFGCSLGSTTSITFCVDSYREYAGEALVTLNFSKSLSSAPLTVRNADNP